MTSGTHFKLYRIVSSIILENENILLVQNRSENASYTWSLPGGQIEKGETIEEALCREVYEETGLTVTGFKIAYIQESFIQEYAAHSLVTVCNTAVKQGENLEINDPDGEITNIKWVPFTEVEHYINNNALVKPLLEWAKNRMTSLYSLNVDLPWGNINDKKISSKEEFE